MKDHRPGLRRAHAILCDILDEVIAEHHATPGTLIFGRATRRHHELMGASRILKKAGEIIAKAVSEAKP